MSYLRYNMETVSHLPQRMNCRLLYITRAYYDSDWESVLHTHHFTELFFVVSGKGNFSIEGETFCVQPDDVIIVNPNVSHIEFGDKRNNLEYIVLGIENLKFSFQEKEHNPDYEIRNFRESKADLLFYLQQILKETHEKRENYSIICHDLLESFLLLLSRKIQTELSFEPSKRALQECRFVEQYLNEHFSEDITLQTLSDITFRNKYYLGHIFKEYKGMSPINYLIKLRIQEAMNLLENSNYSIAKICQAVGFSSQSYFTQVFKRETGISPNKYRQQKCADKETENKKEQIE